MEMHLGRAFKHKKRILGDQSTDSNVTPVIPKACRITLLTA